MAQTVKNLPAVWENQVKFLDREDPLEKKMATHSSILAWEIPWTEEPGGLQSTGHKELNSTEQLTLSLWLVAHNPVHVGVFMISSVQSLSRVRLFATPWIASCQASLSITNSRSLPKLMSIELEMPPNYLILCCPILFLPSIFPNIRVFSNESALCIRWPKY